MSVNLLARLMDVLDRDIHETSAALLLRCLYRLREHLLSLWLVHVRGFTSSAEALSRVVVETTVNIAYLCLGDRLERFNEYFAHYIAEERRQNVKWQNEVASIDDAAGKAVHDRQISIKGEALDTYEKRLSEVYAQMGQTFDKSKRWPKAFERFRALQKELDYRTVYAALSLRYTTMQKIFSVAIMPIRHLEPPFIVNS